MLFSQLDSQSYAAEVADLYKNTPWKWYGNDIDRGCDCYGLACMIHEFHGSRLPLKDLIYGKNDDVDVAFLERKLKAYCAPVTDTEDLDLVLIGSGEKGGLGTVIDNHCIMMTEQGVKAISMVKMGSVINSIWRFNGSHSFTEDK